MRWLDFLLVLPGILLALTIHEYFHGYVAYKLGDPTPRLKGRLTLNPLAHIDPVGFVALLFLHFGWAKPVPINPYNLRNPRRDVVLVSLAGPFSNLISAFLVGFTLRIFAYRFLLYTTFGAMIVNFVVISAALAFFNLIPIPPLDGWHVLEYFLPPGGFKNFMRQYGYYILLILVVLSALGFPLLGMYISITVKFFTRLVFGHLLPLNL
ncbi:MAG: site-2 protease family protein [bacterium]|nr:site-2 protease family protein [bacterium]